MLFTKAFFAITLLCAASTLTKAQNISDYNVVWNSQSANSSGSMPLGGGDIGCNVWVENNDLMLYIGRSGTFDENNSMLKLGRVRLNIYPNPFANPATFKQELKLKEGYIEISGDNNTKIKLWVEVFKPVIHLTITSDAKFTAKAALKPGVRQTVPYRPTSGTKPIALTSLRPIKLPLFTRKDSVLPRKADLIWFHHDRESEMVIDKEAIQQHLSKETDQLWNPN